MTIRLNKFLAERLGLSRREADDLIAAGQIQVDGQPAKLGARVSAENRVVYQGRQIPFEKHYTYLKFNKPVGYVCSRKKQGDADTIYSLLPEKYHALKTVGRLDKDSCGLLLLTDDGDFAYQMTHPKFAKHKTYRVKLDRPLEPFHQQLIADFGVDLPDGKSQLSLTALPADQEPESPTPHEPSVAGSSISDGSSADRRTWLVGMTEGRNRQIRRTFAALGYNVVFLKRLEFGPFSLGALPESHSQEIAV